MALPDASVASIIDEEETRYRQTFQRSLRGLGIMSRRLSCTICDINIKHRLVTRRNVHISLGVLVCNLCSHRIRSANKEPRNKICQWCINENISLGDLISCKQCSRKFCRKCIVTHSRRAKLSDWICYACNVAQLWPLRALCAEAVAYSEKLKKDLTEMRNQVGQRTNTSTRRENMQQQTIHISPQLTATFTPSRMENRRATLHSPRGNLSISVTGSVSLSLTSETTMSSTTLTPSAARRNTITSIPKENQDSLPCSQVETSDHYYCVICLEQKSRIAFNPCGHMCLCETCLPAFKRKFTRCPICKDLYSHALRIYM